jgi:hypothetical protein
VSIFPATAERANADLGSSSGGPSLYREPQHQASATQAASFNRDKRSWFGGLVSRPVRRKRASQIEVFDAVGAAAFLLPR